MPVERYKAGPWKGVWFKPSDVTPELNPQSPIYVGAGTVVRDDGSGTITGTASTTINQPAWIFRHFTQLVCGEVSGNFTTGATTFGSTNDAKTDLDTFSGSTGIALYRLTSPETPEDMAGRLGSQFPIAFYKSIIDGKWKMPVYPTGSPRTAQYFLDPNGTAYKWKVGDDFIADSAQISYTPVDEIINEVHIRYGLYLPTNTYRYDAWCGPTSSDDGTGTRDQNGAAPDNRETICINSKTYYGVKSAMAIDCDMNPNDNVLAKKLRNYIIDRFNRPRLLLKFTTLSRAIGLEPGMVCLVSNDLQDYIPLPWYPGPNARRNWEDMKFFCKTVSFDYTAGIFAHTVVLEEIPV